MFGEAPGAVEGEQRRPWRGRAGRTLRRWLELGENEFYATFYCASVTRCYPGKARSGRGDRTPTPREQELCAFWRSWELELIRPRLIVPVGGLAVRRLLGLKSLTECIGKRFEHDGAVAIPLPHPSGASGWLNDPEKLWLYVGAVVACGILRASLMAARRLISGRQALAVEMDMRHGLFAHLVRLSFGFYDRHQTGQLMSRATVDLQGVRFFLGYGLIFFFQNVITVVSVTSSC